MVNHNRIMIHTNGVVNNNVMKHIFYNHNNNLNNNKQVVKTNKHNNNNIVSGDGPIGINKNNHIIISNKEDGDIGFICCIPNINYE